MPDQHTTKSNKGLYRPQHKHAAFATYCNFVQSILYHMPIYIQQDASLHSLFSLETALHVSGGTTTHHQERIQLYLQHLVFVTPLLLSAAIVEELKPF
jgi:hypothetical protein